MKKSIKLALLFIISTSYIKVIPLSKESIHRRIEPWKEYKNLTRFKESIERRKQKYKKHLNFNKQNHINLHSSKPIKISTYEMNEIQELILEKYQSHLLQTIVNNLFTDKLISETLISQEKLPIISPTDCKKLLNQSKLSEKDKKLLNRTFFNTYEEYQTKKQKLIDKFINTDIDNLKKVCKKYDIQISSNKGFLIKNNSKKYHRRYIPKNLNLNFNSKEINYFFVISPRKWPNKTQNVSRVFNNHKLLNLIKEKKFKYIYPLKQFLCKIPGKNDFPINDNNYIVAIEKIKNLPTPEENYINMKNLPPSKKTEISKEIIEIISNTGISNIDNTTLYLIKDENDSYKVVFLDTAQNGGVGSITNYEVYGDDWAFYTNQERINRSAKTGIKKLTKLLY